jgi:hypothetical protein
VETVGSNIAKETHKFWEALAIIAGVFLVLHAGLTLILMNQVFIFRFFSWAELAIGLGTVIIDAWFLTHV